MADIKKSHNPDCNSRDCECPWKLDYRPLGVRGPRRRLMFRTRKQAERFLTETAHKATRGEYVDPAKVPAFKEVAEVWFKSKTDGRPSHISILRSRIDKYLLPSFGAKRMDAVTVADIEKLRDDLRARSYASTTVNQILRITSAVFRFAIRHGQCATNPLDRVDRARKSASEIKPDKEGSETVGPYGILDPSEIRRLLDAANPGFDRTLFLTAFITGARQGELLALRWTDLELPKEGPGRMYVRRSLQWAHLKGEAIRPRFYPPKTKAGLRAISIPSNLAVVLKRWKLQCPTSDLDLVFPEADGTPMRWHHLLRNRFYPALTRARLRRVTFHSLRHSCASAMIAAGAPVTEVQHHLGHSNPAITLGIYSHWFRNADSGGTVERLASAVIDGPAAVRSSEKWAESGHSDERDSAQSVAGA
jgi:integrase